MRDMDEAERVVCRFLVDCRKAGELTEQPSPDTLGLLLKLAKQFLAGRNAKPAQRHSVEP
jgi:hypothetical protein